MRRTVFSVLVGTMLLRTICAQPCLVKGDAQRVAALETFAGSVRPTLTAVEPSGRIAIVLFPGLISAEQREPVASELTALYKAAGKTSALSLTLAVFNGEGFAASGPFATQKAWGKAVREALTTDQTGPGLSAERLYSMISAPAAALGSDWSSVILAGHLPEPGT